MSAMSTRSFTDGERHLLAAIVRASAACDRDRSQPILSGVGIDRDGSQIRCAGTDGRCLVVSRAALAGIDIPGPVVISRLGIERAIGLYQRMRREIGWNRMHDAEVTARMVTSRSRPALRIECPSTDDGCVCPLVEGSFPNYSLALQRIAYRKGFTAGGGFDPRYLVTALRVLGGRTLVPYNGGRGTIFKNEAGDIVLVMPISLPDADVSEFILGQPDAADA